MNFINKPNINWYKIHIPHKEISRGRIQEVTRLFGDIMFTHSKQMIDVAIFSTGINLDNYFIYLSPKSINVPIVKDFMDAYDVELCSPPPKGSVVFLGGDGSNNTPSL